MTSTFTVLHPGIEAEADSAPKLARRLRALEGRRIAILDNGKVNADTVLSAVARRLQALGAGELRAWKKQHASFPGEKEIPQIRDWRPDLALVGLGD